MKPVSLRFPCGVYGVTPEWSDMAHLTAAVTQAAQGGMTALQWRRKHLSAAEHLTQARTMAALCRTLGVCFIVNDDWRLALAVDADGVHLGRDDGSVRQARQALGDKKILGCSCYNQPELARIALAEGADYVAFGAVYPSATKPDAVRATWAHLAQGKQWVERFALPRPAVVAIGGITPDNAAAVAQAGADSLAMIQGLFGATDIAQAARLCQGLYAGLSCMAIDTNTARPAG